MHLNFYKNKKALLKLLLILTIISFTLLYSSQLNLVSGDNSCNNDELSKVYFPNTSDGEITIITPENITYTEPMEGYYPATYGFENDLDGIIPQEWFLGIATGGTAQVVSELGGRKKVVQMVDTVTNGYPYLTQTFIPQTTGIVEFYVRKESGSTQVGVELRSAGVIATGIRMDYGNNGKFEAYQGAGYLEIATSDYSDQTWFHIKIVFDTLTDTADFYVNGALEASNVAFKQSVASIDTIYFGPNYLYTGSFYFDAVGYSWDSGYSTGDNLNAGLFLSYNNATTLDWKGYSLDGVANNTILGNTTIPLPEDGNHNIQVFGNDSLGTLYESDMRYFDVYANLHIYIDTPENKTYNEPMEGYYPATFGFESDSPGAEGTDINFINRYESDHSLAYVKIIDEMNGHKNVMQLYDGTSSSNANFYAYHDFKANIEFGTIEFWVLNKDYSGDESGVYYNFGNESGQVYVSFDTFNSLFVLIIDNDNNDLVEFQTGNGLFQWAGLYSADIWHHIRIDFESTAGGFSGLDQYHLNFWFDGIKRIDNDPMMINDSLGVIATHSHGFDNVRHDYLDAVGYSWDPTYNIGDNFYEGLLLSFENSSNLDWKGYSLDGNANKTILGNKTISMPSDGNHRIQVFVNDTLGNYYKSNIRHFTIDPSYYIYIDTPESKMYTGPMRGYYLGTYGFEDENDNDMGEEIRFVDYDKSESSSYSKIIPELDGHKKVLETYDSTTSGRNQVTHHIDDGGQIYGSVEFWFRVSNVNLGNNIYFLATEGGYGIIFGVNNGYFRYNDLGNIVVCSANTWYHINLEFECSTSNYQGLSLYSWHVYIDEVIYGDYSFLTNKLDVRSFMFYNGFWADSGGRYYYDAFGFSWDSNYNIGDNLKEGLLLSYTNTTNLNWIGYSLDGSPNITITGNKVIPFPENGVHSIILNGITSNGVLIKSELRSFTILLQDPYIPPENPYMFLIVYASIGIAIITLLSIALFLFRRRIHSRTSSTIISYEKPQLDENVKIGSDLFKVCPLCHAQIKRTDQFCVFCGKSLKND